MTSQQKLELIALYNSYIANLQQAISQVVKSTSVDGRSTQLEDIESLQRKIDYFKRQIYKLQNNGSDPCSIMNTITFRY